MSEVNHMRDHERILLPAVALLVHALLILWLGHGVPNSWNIVGNGVGDTPSYLIPIENLLDGNGYTPDYRMPGYGAPYLLLRLLFDPLNACRGMIVLQWILGAFASVALFRIALCITERKALAYAVFAMSVLDLPVIAISGALLTESFATSALVFAVLLMATDKQRILSALGAGALLTWGIFMRPVFVVFLPILIAWSLWHHRERTRAALQNTMALLIPFLLCEGLWVMRNHHVHHKWILLSSSVHYPSMSNGPCIAIVDLTKAFGGAILWAEPDAEIRFFHPDIPCLTGPRVELPSYVTTSRYDMDSLRSLASEMEQWVRTAAAMRSSEKGMHDLYVTTTAPRAQAIMDSLNHAPLARRIIERAERFRSAFISEHPWRFHIGSRWRVLRNALFRSGTPTLFQHPFRELDLFQQVVKILFSLHYWCVTFGGSIAAFVLLFRRRGPSALTFLSLLVLTGLLIYPIVFRVMEPRYFVPMHPFLLLLLAGLVRPLLPARHKAQDPLLPDAVPSAAKAP